MAFHQLSFRKSLWKPCHSSVVLGSVFAVCEPQGLQVMGRRVLPLSYTMLDRTPELPRGVALKWKECDTLGSTPSTPFNAQAYDEICWFSPGHERAHAGPGPKRLAGGQVRHRRLSAGQPRCSSHGQGSRVQLFSKAECFRPNSELRNKFKSEL